MPGTIRTSPSRARRSCTSEKTSPLPTYRKGSGNRNAAARKTSTAMFTQVTHPKARRYLGLIPRSALPGAGSSPGRLPDTALRGLPGGPEVFEEGRDDAGDGARRLDAARQHKNVGVAGVQRAVVALGVAPPGDLPERVAGRGRKQHVAAPRRIQAAPQPPQGVRVLPVAKPLVRNLDLQRPPVPLDLPRAPRRVPRPVFGGPEPQLAPHPAGHAPALLSPRGEVHAAPAERALDDLLPVHALRQVRKGGAAVGDGDDPHAGPEPGAGADGGVLAEDAAEANVAATAREERAVAVVRERQDRVLFQDPLLAARGLEHVRNVAVHDGDVRILGGEAVVVGDGVALEKVHQRERRGLLLQEHRADPG